MASLAQLHAELIGFLRQHCPVRDQRHLVLLGWMVAGHLRLRGQFAATERSLRDAEADARLWRQRHADDGPTVVVTFAGRAGLDQVTVGKAREPSEEVEV